MKRLLLPLLLVLNLTVGHAQTIPLTWTGELQLRTLGTSIQKSQEAHAEIVRLLAKKGFTDRVPLPDISTKEKAQKYIGLDMKKLEAEKKDFLAKVPPQWDEAARKRQGKLEIY